MVTTQKNISFTFNPVPPSALLLGLLCNLADFTEAVSSGLALVSNSESDAKWTINTCIHKYKRTCTYYTLTYMHRQVTAEVRHQSVHWLYSDQVLQ